jgi:hypothetical protein
MSKQFEFADFIEEFRVDFIAIDEVKGHHNDSGKWIEGATNPRAMHGIILPLSNDDLKRESNGTYTSMDRKIYVIEPMQIGQKIEYKGQTYTIDASKNYEDYADVYIYFAKGVAIK